MPYCAHCGIQITEDMDFCPECGQRIMHQNGQTVATPIQAELVGTEHYIHKNWFERHLNWAMVLTWLSMLLVIYLIGIFIALIDPSFTEAAAEGLGYILGFILPLPVAVWVLKKKKRSLWWLLISGSPFFLLITNKSHTQSYKDSSLKPY